jgi:hypothetical protein
MPIHPPWPGSGKRSRFPKETLRPRSFDLLGAAELRPHFLGNSHDRRPSRLPPISPHVLRHLRRSLPRRSNRDRRGFLTSARAFPGAGPIGDSIHSRRQTPIFKSGLYAPLSINPINTPGFSPGYRTGLFMGVERTGLSGFQGCAK